MDWIIDNIMWIGPSILAGISTIWTYLTTKKNRVLNDKLQKADVQIRESESRIKEHNVDSADVDVQMQRHSLERQMIDYSSEVFTRFRELTDKNMEEMRIDFENDIARLQGKHNELDHLYEQAKQAIATHEMYIAKLQQYTLYLQGILRNNNINYKDEHEI